MNSIIDRPHKMDPRFREDDKAKGVGKYLILVLIGTYW
jgi:hypothetical protein